MYFCRCKRRLTIAATFVFLVSSCAADNESFANRPGFSDYFKQYTPSPNVPDQAQQQLLEKYRPRIYRAIEEDGILQQGPVDFYKSYIARGKLLLGDQMISQQVTQEILNQHRENPLARFIYNGTYRNDGDAVVYARYDTDTLEYNGQSFALEFLSYNLVFPASGLIRGLGLLQSVGLTIAGSLNDWHQLDHYVGLSIILYQGKPIALTLQQHNYQTSYVFNKDLTLPDNLRVQVDIAMRSNELYLHSKNEKRHPAVSFLTEKNMEFMITGENKPFMAGFDITRGDVEINYQLAYLPQSDAIYQFKGHLGKSRLLPGRDGPPGADYVTLPGLMPRALRMVSGYRPGSVEQEQKKIANLLDFSNFSVKPGGIDPFINDFGAAIPELN